MPSKKVVNINWETDRFDDDVFTTVKDINNNMLSSVLSIFGSEELDNVFQHKDEIRFDNSIIKTSLGAHSGFSAGATIAALAQRYDPFVIPPDLIEYIQSEITNPNIYNDYIKALPNSQQLFEKGKLLAKTLLDLNYPSQAAYALAGSAWVECNWDPNVFNQLEKSGGGAKGTANWSGCGEGLFGLTFWTQKEALIKRLSLDKNGVPMYKWDWEKNRLDKNVTLIGTISLNENYYNQGPLPNKNNTQLTGCLFQLKEDMWVNILDSYIENLDKGSGDEKKPYDYLMYSEAPKNSRDSEDDDHKLLYTSYLYKAGPGTRKGFNEMVSIIDKYKDTHKKQTGTSINGFILQMLSAYILAQYCMGIEISLENILGEDYGNPSGFVTKAGNFLSRVFFGGPNYDTIDNNDYTVDGTWFDCVTKMGQWYETNVHTYQGTRQKPRTGRKRYMCNIIDRYVEDDCSSFVKACLYFFGITEIWDLHVSTSLMQPGSKFDNLIRSKGFKCIPYSYDILQPGDIICGGPATHTEIYAGNGKSYSWGNVHDKTGNFQGMPCGFCRTIDYKHIWRYTG